MSDHKTIKLLVGEMEADIDEGIAPLIEQIWQAGILTLNSCQENRPGIVWIEFASVEDATTFMNIVGRYESGANTLYNRMAVRWNNPDGTAEFWEYDLHPDDFAMEETIIDDLIDERHPGLPDFTFAVSIRFPISDMPILLRRLRPYNKGRVLPVPF